MLRRRLAVIAERLERVFGRPRRRLADPLDSLVQTVLSQNTSDVNSDRAFRALKEAFCDWEAVVAAGPRRVERVIRVGGLARTKSRRIVSILETVREREGRYALRRLRRLSPAAAGDWLDALDGVGPKTRACVLLFGCGHPAFPVDTHVHRIVQRLGLVPSSTPAAAQARLEPHVPAGRALDLHLNLIRLGRSVCRPRAPRCGECPLDASCAHARSEAAA